MNGKMLFLPLGGTGEIGMNCNLYGFADGKHTHWIMVDAGVSFAPPAMPGIDLIMPDLEFIAQQKENLLGLFLTHGHEDHIGAVGHLWRYMRCPIYATAFTAELVRGKLAEAGLDDVPLQCVTPGDVIRQGNFSVDYIGLTHSIAEAHGLLIETPAGRAFHTGDWKIDPAPLIGAPTQIERLKEIGAQGIDAIICDSTNVLNAGRAGSEAKIYQDLHDTIADKTGRVVVTGFASNVARMHSVARAAQAHGRHICLLGWGMHKIYNAAKSSGYFADFPELIAEDHAGFFPSEKILFLCTGSQGEPNAALARLAEDRHPHITLDKNDCVIFSARMIPGNEADILRLHNLLVSRGIEVITAQRDYLHASGHPCRDELADMYGWIKPRAAIPVHGEARHLIEHARFASELGVQEPLQIFNGDMVRLAPAPTRMVEKVKAGRVYCDGNIIVTADNEAIKQRKKLAYGGVVLVTIIVDQSGYLRASPKIDLMGVPEYDNNGIDMKAWVCEAVDRTIPKTEKIALKGGADKIRISVRRIVRQHYGKKIAVRVKLIEI